MKHDAFRMIYDPPGAWYLEPGTYYLK